jgi:hypothetical protein
VGAAWLNGGDFGVEASPIAVAVCLVGSALLLRIALRRGQIVTYRAARDGVAVRRSGS